MKIDEEIDENYTKETLQETQRNKEKSSEDLNEEIEGSQEVDGNPIETPLNSFNLKYFCFR